MKNWGWSGALLLTGLALVASVRADLKISGDVSQLAQHVRTTGDSEGGPFAIVDKRAALLVVFHANGQLAGHTAALLGSDHGDTSAVGVGERTQRGALQPGDATTPAGRFVTQPGRNLTGEKVIWVDFDAAFAIHRLRPGLAHASRARRLTSADPADNRVSAGCVVVPVVFFERVVLPVLGDSQAVVYVLPEGGLAAAGWGAVSMP